MFAKNCVFAFCGGLLLCVMNQVGLASVGDTDVSVFFRRPPTQLEHCKPYTMDIEAKINNPKARSELRPPSIVWTLDSQFEYLDAVTGEHDLLIEPSNPIRETFNPTWTVFKYKRIAGRGIIGKGANQLLYPRDFERASYFKTPGKWKVTYTATVYGQDKNDQNKQCRLTGSNNFNTTISAPKLLICAVEGLGGSVPGNDHLQNLLNGLPQDNDYKHEYQTLANTSGLNIVSKAEDKIYHFTECGCNHIALVGYSYGGHEVIKIAGTLGNNYAPSTRYKKRNIPINLLFTIDPVKQLANPTNGGYNFTKPGNVSSAINFYQQVDRGSVVGMVDVHGDSVAGATNTQFLQSDFTVPQAHVEITMLPDVLDALKKALEDAKPK